MMQCPPGISQLFCRPIDQFGNLAIRPGQVRVLQPVVPAAVCTETAGRLARVLASRSIVDWSFHRLAGSAMRYTRPRSSLAEARASPRFFFKVPEDTANGMTLPTGHARHLVDRCALGLTQHRDHHVLL